jgi:hypothetical protein
MWSCDVSLSPPSPPPMIVPPTPPPPMPMTPPTQVKPPRKPQQASFVSAALAPGAQQSAGARSLIGGAPTALGA